MAIEVDHTVVVLGCGDGHPTIGDADMASKLFARSDPVEFLWIAPLAFVPFPKVDPARIGVRAVITDGQKTIIDFHGSAIPNSVTGRRGPLI